MNIFFFFLIYLILTGKTTETTTAEKCRNQAELWGFQEDFGRSAQWNRNLHKMVLFL